MEGALYSRFKTPTQTMSRIYETTDIEIKDLTFKEPGASMLAETEIML